MIDLLLESYLTWLVIGVLFLIVGYALTVGLSRKIFFLSGASLAILAFALGAVLVFCVDSDRKSIKRTIFTIEKAVRENDAETTVSYLASNSIALRKLVEYGMRRATIERANVSAFKIDEINKTTSPPRAKVSFRGVVVGKTDGGYDFVEVERFDVLELRQEQDGVWRVTDKMEVSRGF